VYGWGLLTLTAFFDGMEKMNIPTTLTLLAVSPILTLLEAAMGGMSRWYFGEKRWDYPKSYYPAFGGTVSLVTGVYFAIGGILFWVLAYRPFLSKL
jgi:hypothetical protein